MNKTVILRALRFMTLILAVLAVPVSGQTTSGPQAVTPYTLTVFAQAPSGLSAPDSIAVLKDHVFIGYGDGHAPDGSDGLSSQVVEYDLKGNVIHTYTVVGHNDGIKIDPVTHLVWAMQNEDLNPNLVIINPQNHQQTEYTFGPTPHGRRL